MTPQEAHSFLSNARAAGRLATGYLVVGDLRGQALECAELVLRDLFPGEADVKTHPDVHWLEPEKKSRIISVEAVNERLVDPLASTSYAGGWKVGVIAGADCLNTSSSNAFLKTLEEPTPKTLFLLLTDAPERILPTIRSRCQRIDLDDARSRGLDEPWRSRVINALADPALADGVAKAALAARLAGILAELREKAEELVDADEEEASAGASAEVSKEAHEARISARYREYRRDFLHTLMGWFRDLLAVKAGGTGMPLVNEGSRETLRARAAYLTLAQCLYAVEAVEELDVSMSRNLKEDALLAFFADRVAFGCV